MTAADQRLPAKKQTRNARNIVQYYYCYIQKSAHWLTGSNQAQIITDAIPFQGDIDEIIEERPLLYIRPVFYIVVLLFITAIIVASIIQVDVVVVGTGRLITSISPLVLQPIDRAIIRELKVRAGDKITKGQVLAVLDSTFTQADLAALSEQKEFLQEKVSGLDAELKTISSEGGGAPDTTDILRNNLYSQRITQYRSRLRVFDKEIISLQSSVRATEGDRDFFESQLVIARDVEAMRSKLSQSQSGSKIQYLEAQAARMRAERDYQNAINHLVELRQDTLSKQAERQYFIDEWRRQALDDLVSARTELSTVSENLIKAARMNDLLVLTAPEAGVVLEVTKLSTGSVLSAAEHLVTIVPDNAVLVAEIGISSTDVGHVKSGDDVTVKIDAFPYQRHGVLPGRLLWVSEVPAQTESPERGSSGSGLSANASHHGWVELFSTEMKNMPEDAKLIPGMTLSADIKVGARSIVAYIIYPITRAFTDAAGN